METVWEEIKQQRRNERTQKGKRLGSKVLTIHIHKNDPSNTLPRVLTNNVKHSRVISISYSQGVTILMTMYFSMCVVCIVYSQTLKSNFETCTPSLGRPA